MILKGFLRHFDAFSLFVTHSNKELSISEFKTEETLKHRDLSGSKNIMNLTSSFSMGMKNKSREGQDVSCFTRSTEQKPVPTTTTKDENRGAAL